MVNHRLPQLPNHELDPEQILTDKQNETLQEALTCTSCPIHLSKADMDRDTQSGKYDPSRDPPFLTSSPRSRRHSRSASSDASGSYDHDHGHGNNSDYASSSPDDHDHDHDEKDMDIDMAEGMEQQDRMECDDDDVSPLDTTPNPHPRATYASLTTSAQRQQYQTRVLEALSDLIGPLGCTNDDWDESYSPPPPPQTLSDVQGVVDEDDIRFACYRVDYHIHLHERARSSTLSMCRDIDDVWQLRGWQTEVRQLDREVLGMDPPDDKKEEEEDGLLAVHQLAVWRRAWRARERRVHEVRKTWDGIVAERRRQRAKFLHKRRDHGGKIRFYTRQEGNRVLLREFSL